MNLRKSNRHQWLAALLLVVSTGRAFGAPAPATPPGDTPATPLVEETSAITAPAAGGSADAWKKDSPEMVAAALKDIPAAPAGPFKESWDSIQ